MDWGACNFYEERAGVGLSEKRILPELMLLDRDEFVQEQRYLVFTEVPCCSDIEKLKCIINSKQKVMMNTEESLKFYDLNYSELFSYLPNSKHNVTIGKKQNRICRFCGKKEGETTFRTVAHSIPESLGNKKIITADECDECNAFFSNNIEIHFDKISKPYRQIGQIKGKKGVPGYKTRSKQSRIDCECGLVVKESIKDVIVNQLDNNTSEFNYEIEPYVPIAAYKTLVKMAISVMPENELKFVKETISWIRNEDHSQKLIDPAIAIETFIPGPRPIDGIAVLLLKRKSEKKLYPTYIFNFGYGNVFYQILIPTLLDQTEEKIIKCRIKDFPVPYYDDKYSKCYGNPQVRYLNLTSHNIVRNTKLPVRFHHDEKKRIELSN